MTRDRKTPASAFAKVLANEILSAKDSLRSSLIAFGHPIDLDDFLDPEVVAKLHADAGQPSDPVVISHVDPETRTITVRGVRDHNSQPTRTGRLKT